MKDGERSYLGSATIDEASQAGWRIRRTCFECRTSDWIDLDPERSRGLGAAPIEVALTRGVFACPACSGNDIFLATADAGPNGSTIFLRPFENSQRRDGRIQIEVTTKITYVPFLVEEGKERKPYIPLHDQIDLVRTLPEVVGLKQASARYGGRNRLRALLTDVNGRREFKTTGCAWMITRPSLESKWCCGGYVDFSYQEWEKNTLADVTALGERLAQGLKDEVASSDTVQIEVHVVQFELQPYYLLSFRTFCLDFRRKEAFLRWEALTEASRRFFLKLSSDSVNA